MDTLDAIIDADPVSLPTLSHQVCLARLSEWLARPDACTDATGKRPNWKAIQAALSFVRKLEEDGEDISIVYPDGRAIVIGHESGETRFNLHGKPSSTVK